MRAVDDDEAARLIANASACVDFTEWLVKTLVRSAYPGAPYERKQTAGSALSGMETLPFPKTLKTFSKTKIGNRTPHSRSPHGSRPPYAMHASDQMS